MAATYKAPRLGARRLSALFRGESKFLEAEASAGDHLQVMGRQQCWEAVGPARETFAHLAMDIKEYLTKCSDTVSSSVTWSLYMTGRTKETSHPTVVFCSSEPDARRTVRRSIKCSDILKGYPGFITMDCNRPPGSQSAIVPLTGDNVDWSPSSVTASPLYTVFVHPVTSSAMGAKLSICKKQEAPKVSKMATGGGILEWRGKRFLTTVAHVFADFNKSSISEDGSTADFEFDVDSIHDEDEEDEDFLNGTSRGSMTPRDGTSDASSTSDAVESLPSSDGQWSRAPTHLTTLLQDDSHKSNPQIRKGSFAEIAARDQPQASDVSFEGPFLSSIDGSHSSLDYALVEISGSKLEMMNTRLLKGKVMRQELFAREVALEGPFSREVLAVTASKGLLSGRLSGTPSFMQLPHDRSQQELWTVQLNGNLEKGDCGTWVLDAVGGIVYGQIVAGSPGSGFGYIIPLWQILGDLRRRLDGDWSLAAEQNPMPRGWQPDIRELSRTPMPVTNIGQHPRLVPHNDMKVDSQTPDLQSHPSRTPISLKKEAEAPEQNYRKIKTPSQSKPVPRHSLFSTTASISRVPAAVYANSVEASPAQSWQDVWRAMEKGKASMKQRQRKRDRRQDEPSAQVYFLWARHILLTMPTLDHSSLLQVLFCLTNVELEMTFNKDLSLDERHSHLLAAEYFGTQASEIAGKLPKAWPLALIKLWQAVILGRGVELAIKRGVNTWKVSIAKEGIVQVIARALRGLQDSELWESNDSLLREYERLAKHWQKRLSKF